MDPDPHSHHFSSSTVQFQIPQFVLGGTPNLAHGGGAEVIPGMYGQGTQAWSDYDKYWYDNATPSKYYSLADLVAEPPSSNAAPRPSQTPRPFEFTDSPPENEASTTSSPGPHPMDLDDDADAEHPYLADHPVVPSNTLPYPQDTDTATAPFAQYPGLSISNFSLPSLNFLDPTAPLPPLPPSGLPLYSASGFDMLKMLSKVVTRPNPKIMLGPVDMTCSFVVVDVRRFDAPIAYASPTFSRLTGYSEAEVRGRNCRFLQAPSGQVARGEERRYTAPDAVRHMQKCLLQEKECQASLINYRKDGAAFINLVTVIPVAAEDGSDEITHHVGFQVDLAEQPNAILQKLRDGSYIVNYSSSASASQPAGAYGAGRERRARGVSQDMVEILRGRRPWVQGQGAEPGAKPTRDHERAELHAMLLENTDDFVHVVSLKGSLLYVAPSVQRVLGYDPTELVGKSIADLCHPADIVPLMRELKEASSTSAPPTAPPHPSPSPSSTPSSKPLFVLPSHPQHSPPPKPVNLLFRAQHKRGEYVWLEARGRLHVEQGKGRKAVVLVGRRSHVPRIRWGAVVQQDAEAEAECWGLVAPNGLVLSASGAGAEKLGYGEDGAELVGRSLASLVEEGEGRRVGDVLAGAACADRDETRRVRCGMLVRGGEGQGRAVRTVGAEVVFYAREGEGEGECESPRAPSLPFSLVFQIRFLGATHATTAVEESAPLSTTLKSVLGDASSSSSSRSTILSPSSSPHDPQCPRPRTPHPPETDVLEELDTSRETSWQYELTRLRFENERMREEVGKLERVRRTQSQMPYLRRHMGLSYRGDAPVMSSLGVPLLSLPRPPSHPQSHLNTSMGASAIALPPGLPQKRLRDGEPKLPSPT